MEKETFLFIIANIALVGCVVLHFIGFCQGYARALLKYNIKEKEDGNSSNTNGHGSSEPS